MAGEFRKGRLSLQSTWEKTILESAHHPKAKHIALTLATYMNRLGEGAFPGIARLARQTRYSTGTVKKYLAQLRDGTGEAPPVLEVIPGEGLGRGKGRATNTYRPILQDTEAAQLAPVKSLQGPGGERYKGRAPGHEDASEDARTNVSPEKASTEDAPKAAKPSENGRAPKEPGLPKQWPRMFADAWRRRGKGTAPYARIGKALKPLVQEHGVEAVLEAWERYLHETDMRYWSPEAFAQRFGQWARAGPGRREVVGGIPVEDGSAPPSRRGVYVGGILVDPEEA